jgi:hypothetical protein
MLGKQFCQTRDPISLGIGDEKMIALVVVQRWTNVPCIRVIACPGTPGSWGFVNYGLAPQGGTWETVPIVWTVYGFVCENGGIDARRAQHVEGGLNLWYEMIPQLQRKIAIVFGKRTDEVCFKCLNHAFGGIDSVIIGLDKEIVALLLGKKLFMTLLA